MFKTTFKKINDVFAIGSPLENGFKPVSELNMVFLVSLTGTGATVTIEKLAERYADLLIMPTRKLITDEVTIPWSQQKQNKPLHAVNNRKIRYELNKYFRKYHEGGFAEVLEQMSYNTDRKIDYCIFDNLRHVKELAYANKKFKNIRYVLFKAKMIDRIKRITHRDYSFSDIGLSGFYKNIYDIPGWKSVISTDEIEEIRQALDNGELELEAVNKAMQIIIKEHEEYDHHKLAMKLYDIAHDNTLLIDSSQLNPQERALEIYNWLITSKS
jgi:hypothetical protein